MPAPYAHYRFGREALSLLPRQAQIRIGRFRGLFNAGLQGPDFFFFCNIFVNTAAVKLGSHYHAMSGKAFFEAAVPAEATLSDAQTAYLYGVLAHYALDSLCHPLVHTLTDSGEIGHSELETEFDRYLLALDGVEQPQLYSCAQHVHVTRGECVTIAGFYPPATAGNVYGGFRSMERITSLLSMKNRKIVEGIGKHMGSEARQHLMPAEPNPRCADHDEPMLTLFGQALSRYATLSTQLETRLGDGSPLGADFDPIFG